MILNSLEIQGFKSFPDKTKLEFNHGLTAVVGPNGSGKSNISDAVRWVLGEQSTKTLRGEKMEDIIFNGTEQRKSQGFAQVSLNIDNSDRGLVVDSDEVTITRKYYRSGDSEYLINGSNVRLKDINELFMDTGLGKYGYSMIGQGKIAEIVGAKSNERREIFEEASGISKFRYRKNESERRLRMAEENLLRLRDILVELEDRVEPLKIQSEKAKKYLEYADKRRVLEISLWVDKLDKSTQLMREHMDKLMICKNDYSKSEKDAAILEEQTSDVYARMQECLVDMDELRRTREVAKADAAGKTAQTAVLENDIVHHKSEIERLQGEINAYTGSNEQMDDSEEKKRAEIGKAKLKLVEIEKQAEEKQHQLLNLTQETDAQSDISKQLSDGLNRLTLNITELKMQIMSAQNTISTLNARSDIIEETNKKREQELVNTKVEQQEIIQGLEQIEEKDSGLANALNGYALKLNSRREKLDKTLKQYNDIEFKIKEKLQKARLLSDLEQNMEGFAYSVKTIVKAGNSGAVKGILGTVSQLLSVEKKYSVAIETALGGSMQNIVVENESTAKSAIATLKSQNAGRATFLPLTSVKGNRLLENSLESIDGYISLACDLVKADAKFSGIINSLLGRTVVTDDLDTAVVVAKKHGYRFKIVTLDGQVVNAGGSFTGGSQNKSQGILSRKNDIELLKSEAKKLEAQQGEINKSLNDLKAETAELDAQVVAIKSERIVLSEDKIRFEGEKKRVDHIVNEMRNAIDAALDELDLADIEKQKQLKLSKESERILGETEQSLATQQIELQNLDGSKSGLETERIELSEAISELKIRRMELLKDIDLTGVAIAELVERRESANEHTKSLYEKKNQLEQQNEVLINQIEEVKSDANRLVQHAADLETRISEVSQTRNQLESSTSQIRSQQKSLVDMREGLARELARLEERKCSMERDTESIINRMWEEYSLSRSEADEVAQKIENTMLSQKDLNEIKSKIKGLGSVNVDSIEEYKDVAERYEFLAAQVQDAEKARDELMRLINDLTGRMQTIFAESFAQINENFSRIFKELFDGGKAHLALTDEKNILDSGIEIYVQPPGKIINNLSSLSGGEQAFVAIAIYFAILKVRPAPFCILDEIEAALDESNVVKYARYLRNISGKTQFIMITHRRGSMEEADVLYGVTMQEKGISKLLRLDISEIEEQIGLK